MPALCLILNSAHYANNYTGIFEAGLVGTKIKLTFCHYNYTVIMVVI